MVKLNIDIPDGFLNEEVRCGYTVTKQMKEVWAVELDILEQLKTICEKYNLTYVGSGGTMLGAIRHQGFIPWDDDIDIDMSREDYDRLCEVAEKEFKYPYFFQTEYTVMGTMRGHAQIRRTDTTAILNSENNKVKFNQGIFIDIFPQDNIPDEKNELKKYISDIVWYKKISGTINRYSNYKIIENEKSSRLAKKILYPVFLMLHVSNIDTWLYKKMEKCARKYKDIETKKVAGVTFLPEREKIRFQSEYLKETISVRFEFTTIKVSAIYKSILTQMYGDYTKFVLGESQHGETFFDTDCSYINYI